MSPLTMRRSVLAWLLAAYYCLPIAVATYFTYTAYQLNPNFNPVVVIAAVIIYLKWLLVLCLPAIRVALGWTDDVSLLTAVAYGVLGIAVVLAGFGLTGVPESPRYLYFLGGALLLLGSPMLTYLLRREISRGLKADV